MIEDVEKWIPGLGWQDRITKEKYEARKYPVYGTDAEERVIDHFNEIMRWLFVDNIYEHSDKLQFINSLGLKICPYCGRNHINVAVGDTVSKPSIDHFLPKSRYPFLAISFRNMVPCCHTCNDISNKGSYDPLPALGLHNPYEFDDDSVTFVGKFNVVDKLDKTGYDVDIRYDPTTLSVGYNDQLKLLQFYKQEQLIMQDMYCRYTSKTPAYKKLLKYLRLRPKTLDKAAMEVLAHPMDGRASEREFYKFKRDLLIQLLREYCPA